MKSNYQIRSFGHIIDTNSTRLYDGGLENEAYENRKPVTTQSRFGNKKLCLKLTATSGSSSTILTLNHKYKYN